MKVTVAYALPERQTLLVLDLPEGATLERAILESGILAQHPEIDLARNRVGVNGKVKPLAFLLKAGDRAEIYRPRLADPKAARHERVRKARA